MVGRDAHGGDLQNVPFDDLHIAILCFTHVVNFVSKRYVADDTGFDVLTALVFFGSFFGSIWAPFCFDVEAAVTAEPGFLCYAEYDIAVVIPEPRTTIVHTGQIHGTVIVHQHFTTPPAFYRSLRAEAKGEAGVGGLFYTEALWCFAPKHLFIDGFDVEAVLHGFASGGLEGDGREVVIT